LFALEGGATGCRGLKIRYEVPKVGANFEVPKRQNGVTSLAPLSHNRSGVIHTHLSISGSLTMYDKTEDCFTKYFEVCSLHPTLYSLDSSQKMWM
jgi:hypothetical protein